MQIFPLIDPYSVHFDTYAANLYTLSTDSVTLTAGTLTAEQLTSTDDITMQGHTLTIGNNTDTTMYIIFDGLTNNGLITYQPLTNVCTFNPQYLWIGNTGILSSTIEFATAGSNATLTGNSAQVLTLNGTYVIGDGSNANRTLTFANSGTDVVITGTSNALDFAAANLTTTGIVTAETGQFNGSVTIGDNAASHTLTFNVLVADVVLTATTAKLDFGSSNLTISADNYYLAIGATDTDLRLYSDGTNGVITTAAELYLLSYGAAAYKSHAGVSGLVVDIATSSSHYAFESWARATGNIGYAAGFYGGVRDTGATNYNITTVYGAGGYNIFSGTGVRTIGTAYGNYSANNATGSSNLTIATAIGGYFSAQEGGAPSIGTAYTLYLAGTNVIPSVADWVLYSPNVANSCFAGNLRIGSTTAPTVELDVTGNVKIVGNGAGTAFSVTTASTKASSGYINFILDTNLTGGVLRIGDGVWTNYLKVDENSYLTFFGTASLGGASTDVIPCLGRLTLRQIASDPTGSATAGTIGEIVYCTGDNNFYGKHTTTATDTNWRLL